MSTNVIRTVFSVGPGTNVPCAFRLPPAFRSRVLTERPDGMVSPQVGPLHRWQVAVPQVRLGGRSVCRTERRVWPEVRVFPPPGIPDVPGPGHVHAGLEQFAQRPSLDAAGRINGHSCERIVQSSSLETKPCLSEHTFWRRTKVKFNF